jgi:hypothetical protein
MPLRRSESTGADSGGGQGPVFTLEGRVHYDSCVQYCFEVLNLRIDLLDVHRQEGCELVDGHP